MFIKIESIGKLKCNFLIGCKTNGAIYVYDIYSWKELNITPNSLATLTIAIASAAHTHISELH